jgi:hypothetical protein
MVVQVEVEWQMVGVPFWSAQNSQIFKQWAFNKIQIQLH